MMSMFASPMVAIYLCPTCGEIIRWYSDISEPNRECGPHLDVDGKPFMSVMLKVWPSATYHLQQLAVIGREVLSGLEDIPGYDRDLEDRLYNALENVESIFEAWKEPGFKKR